MKRTSQPRRRKGFTLIEVLMVLVILVIIASGVGLAISSVMRSANKSEAELQVQRLKQGCKLFFGQMRRFPDELSDLVEDPGDNDNWEPCLEQDTIPLDPWGNEYNYELGDNGDFFRVWSYGPDMSDGTDDDIYVESR